MKARACIGVEGPVGVFDAIIVWAFVTWSIADEEGCNVLLKRTGGVLPEQVR